MTPHVSAAGYADALERLHLGMRMTGVPAPHVTERVADAPGHGQRALRNLLGALRSGPPWPALDVVMRE